MPCFIVSARAVVTQYRPVLSLLLCAAGLAASLSLPANADPKADSLRLAPFVSDGCSAWPDGTFAQANLWLSCCETHDKAYWMGGTREQRKQADEALRDCVADIGQPEIAEIMLAGVRVGGSPWWPTSFRWGYGWPWPRGYRALDDADRRAVKARLKNQP